MHELREIVPSQRPLPKLEGVPEVGYRYSYERLHKNRGCLKIGKLF